MNLFEGILLTVYVAVTIMSIVLMVGYLDRKRFGSAFIELTTASVMIVAFFQLLSFIYLEVGLTGRVM